MGGPSALADQPGKPQEQWFVIAEALGLELADQGQEVRDQAELSRFQKGAQAPDNRQAMLFG